MCSAPADTSKANTETDTAQNVTANSLKEKTKTPYEEYTAQRLSKAYPLTISKLARK